MVDPSDWLPLIGVGMLAFTTLGSILGAYAIGRARRREREDRRLETPDRDRLERMEQTLETLALEMERLSESQRFLVKIIGDRPLPRADATKSPPRVITPH